MVDNQKPLCYAPFITKKGHIFMEKKKFRTVDLAYIGLFVALMTVCSWISIKTPWDISFTLQTFAVFAAVGTLGLLRGTMVVIIYILLGLVGVPVFSNFGAGPAALFGTTGGYIVGFIFSAVIVGVIQKFFGNKLYVSIIAMIIGLIACYAFGTAWFVIIYTQNKGPVGIMTALGWCVFPYIIPDLVKLVVAAFVSKRVSGLINRE